MAERLIFKKLFIIIFLFCFTTYNKIYCSNIWSDRHGTASTSGMVDTGTRFDPDSVLSPPLVLLWSYIIGEIHDSSPVIADGKVYVGGLDGLYAFYTDSGIPVTGFPVATGPILSSPAIANNTVYVGATDNRLYAFDMQTGLTVDNYPKIFSQIIISSPAIKNNYVYIGTTDIHGLVSYFGAYSVSGVQNPGFVKTIEGVVESSPAVSSGKVYVGGGNSLYAFDEITGENINGFPVNLSSPSPIPTPYIPFPTQNVLLASPVVSNGIVYIGCMDGYLYAFNAFNGQPISGFPVYTSGPINSSPAVAYGYVFILSQNGYLYAINAYTGTVKEGFPVYIGGAGPSLNSSPAIANGYVYAGGGNNTIYAIDIANGNIVWQFKLPSNGSYTTGFNYCSPSIAENKLFITSEESGGIFVFCMHSPTATITPIITITPEATITPVDTRIPAKLEITMQVIDTTVSAGNYVEVRIKIKNIGEVVAQNILLQQIIPFMTIFDQDYLDNKYWIYKGKSIQRNIGDLNPGEGIYVTYFLKPDENLHDGEIINIQPAGAEFNMYQDSPFPRTVVYSNSGSFAIGAIIVYPNILDLKKGGAVKFINLPKDTKVIIYTISGEVVQEYRNISSIVLWNGKNINERIVSPGFYYYVISWEKGKKKKTGKIFVID